VGGVGGMDGADMDGFGLFVLYVLLLLFFFSISGGWRLRGKGTWDLLCYAVPLT